MSKFPFDPMSFEEYLNDLKRDRQTGNGKIRNEREIDAAEVFEYSDIAHIPELQTHRHAASSDAKAIYEK